MTTVPTEEIDVERLKTEILANASVSALPCNMSDEWLMLLARDLSEALDHPDIPCIARTRSALFAAMAVVMYLLTEKLKTRQLAVSPELLRDYCRRYQMELQLELMRRRVGIPLIPATLETILTDRETLWDGRDLQHGATLPRSSKSDV
ncbi:MAG: hypothetical protein EOP50_00035 [Sphingobacteriales bacterium]|nr:MAG: hypothetical protein EOP50_00035 [Sphingobacteriales bacterium]